MNSTKLQAALARIDAAKKKRLEEMGITSTIPTPVKSPIHLVINSLTSKDIPHEPDFSTSLETPNLQDSTSSRHQPELQHNSETSGDIPKRISSESAEFLNSAQLSASNSIIAGESICLIGKAGTGKTTAIRETVARLIRSARIPILRDTDGHKWLRAGYAGVVCCAFTNRATNNIAKGFDLGSTPIHFITVHKLLEYTKEEFYATDKETGLQKKSMRFIPGRTRYNPLPAGIKLIILEESSQINKQDLHAKLLEACTGRSIQFVYLGDVQQLPPIGGDGILGYKINELPTVELTQIYRQAAENPIIRLAWDIASGRQMTKADLIRDYSPVRDRTAPIQINFWEGPKLDWEFASIHLGKMWTTQIDAGVFDWEKGDIILMPYNKKMGTIALNKTIAQHISIKKGIPTHEIIAGFQKHYYAVGDKVLYAKKEGIIERITRNGRYIGRTPLPADVGLTRDGTYESKTVGTETANADDHMSEEELDQYLANLNSAEQSGDEDVVNQASHICHIKLISEQMPDGSTEVDVSTRGEYGELEFAYAISIHKSQGSEWRKVFLILHNSHHQLNREMLYTAVTRASQQLFIICETDSFRIGVSRQRIPGDTLEEKKAWFRKKIEEQKAQQINEGDDDDDEEN